jgi:hypothetical protein
VINGLKVGLTEIMFRWILNLFILFLAIPLGNTHAFTVVERNSTRFILAQTESKLSCPKNEVEQKNALKESESPQIRIRRVRTASGNTYGQAPATLFNSSNYTSYNDHYVLLQLYGYSEFHFNALYLINCTLLI